MAHYASECYSSANFTKQEWVTESVHLACQNLFSKLIASFQNPAQRCKQISGPTVNDDSRDTCQMHGGTFLHDNDCPWMYLRSMA